LPKFLILILILIDQYILILILINYIKNL